VQLLREWRVLSQELGLWWAVTRERVLLVMTRTTDDARTRGRFGLSPPEITDGHARVLTLLDEGERVPPRLLTPQGPRGRATPHPGRLRLDRVRTHQDAVLAFLSDLAGPGETTLADRDFRRSNVPQDVSGTFRSDEGAICFARMRGALSTLRPQGQPLFPALEATVRGQPVLPSFEAS